MILYVLNDVSGYNDGVIELIKLLKKHYELIIVEEEHTGTMVKLELCKYGDPIVTDGKEDVIEV